MRFISVFLSAVIGFSFAYNFSGDNSIELTVVMYHSILNSKKGVYVLSENALDNDLYAFERAGFTYVFPSEVINYVYGDGKLPKKPLMITFDDGHYNNLFYALPLLVKHDAKACISVIGKFSDYSSYSGEHSKPNYSHLTWEQVGILSKSGYFEVGNHTYNMHNYTPRFGISKTLAETKEEYRENLQKDITLLNQKIYGATKKTPLVFAYPFGKYNDDAKEVLLSLDFKMLLTCNEGKTTLKKGQPTCLHYVKRFNRNGLISTYEFMQKIT